MTVTEDVEKKFNQLMKRSPSGRLNAEDVVEAARDPNSPLHQYFTWSDSEAAERWRMQEAQNLIRSFSIYNEELKIRVRALTSLEDDREEGGGYRWTIDVLQRPDLREQYLISALKDLEAVRKRYAHVQELVALWQAIDEAQALPKTAPVAL